MHGIRLIKGNSFELIKQLRGVGASLVIADPPYGVTKNPWECHYDMDSWFSDIWPCLSENGAIVHFGQDKFTAKAMLREYHRYNLIWEKDRPSGHLNAKRMPMRSHEDMAVFYRKMPIYNPQMVQGKKNNSIGTEKIMVVNRNYSNYKHVQSQQSGMKYPRSVWYYPRPHPAIHSTQKPVELMEELIRTYTNEGDLVIDPFMGVGGAALACIRTNRKYIGIELDDTYFSISELVCRNHEAFKGSPNRNTLISLNALEEHSA